MSINISLSYEGVKCDNGHENTVTMKACHVCGKSLMDVYKERDDNVEERKSKLKKVLSIIETNKQIIKSNRKSIKKGIFQYTTHEDEIQFIQNAIHTLSELNDMNVFDNLDFTGSLDREEVETAIQRIESFFNSIYVVYFEILYSQVSIKLKNIHYRLKNTTYHFINSYTSFVDCMTCNTLIEAQEIKKEAQKHMDMASEELNIVNTIMNSSDYLEPAVFFEGGTINMPVILSCLTLGGDSYTLLDRIAYLKKVTYYYYKDFLKDECESYENEHYLYLAPYRFLGTTVFDDERYIRKTHVAKNLIDKAYEIKKDEFQDFLELYYSKFEYMTTKLTEFALDSAFMYGNNANENLIMKKMLDWYKDFAEGIYRDSSKILYYALKVVTHKPVNFDDVLDSTNFAKVSGELSDAKKYNTHLLTEGLSTVVRHAVAHVDYNIDKQNRKIIFPNRVKIKTGKTINTETYSFEEFSNLFDELSESIFAIISAFTLFLIDNRNDFDKLSDQYLNSFKQEDIPPEDIILPLNGLVLLEKSITVENTKKNLILKTQFENEDNKFSIYEFMNPASILSYGYEDIDIIHLYINDFFGESIGSLAVHADYFRNYQETDEPLRDYFFILGITAIRYYDINGEEMNPQQQEFMFLDGIIGVFIKSQQEFLNALKLATSTDNKQNSLMKWIELLKSIISIIDKYSDDSYDIRMILHLKDVFVRIKYELVQIEKFRSNTSKTSKHFTSLGDEILRLQIVELLTKKEMDANEFYYKHTSEGIKYVNNLSPNAPCFCGSGRKFKHCCKDELYSYTGDGGDQ
jgi:hypothetical protein